MSVASLMLVVFAAAVLPVVVVHWSSLSSFFLDLKAPVIQNIEALPRGIGVAPVNFRINLNDSIYGLKEAVVWCRQEGQVRELLRKQISGLRADQISFSVNGPALHLKEGRADIIVRATDGSWWRNTGELMIPLNVDFEKPRIDIFPSEGSSMREGSSHLVFFRASDKRLILTGVKVGKDLAQGIPAGQMDRGFSEASMYACLFGVDLPAGRQQVRLIGEDLVGNTASVPLGQVIPASNGKRVERVLNEDLIRGHFTRLLESNISSIDKLSREKSGSSPDTTADQTSATLYKIKLLIEELSSMNSGDIFSRLSRGPRSDRIWEGPFLRPVGEIKSGYGDVIAYMFGGKEIASFVQTGIEVVAGSDSRDVASMNDGFVSLNGDFGTYGKVTAVDHGMGLVSVYGNLDTVNVLRGERVKRGQIIGAAGNSGLLTGVSYYVELRINGTPVDPQDWWNVSWYEREIAGNVDNVKRTLGIPIMKPVERRF